VLCRVKGSSLLRSLTEVQSVQSGCHDLEAYEQLLELGNF
jgi:hypothetical protein